MSFVWRGCPLLKGLYQNIRGLKYWWKNVKQLFPYCFNHLSISCSACSYNDPQARPGEVVCFKQQITLTTVTDEGGQVWHSLSLPALSSWSSQSVYMCMCGYGVSYLTHSRVCVCVCSLVSKLTERHSCNTPSILESRNSFSRMNLLTSLHGTFFIPHYPMHIYKCI